MNSDYYRMETERVLIRPYNDADAEGVFKVVSQREIYLTTINIPHPYPRENVNFWIDFTRKNMKYGLGYEFGIFDKLSADYIGNIGIVNISKQNNHGEMTYFIDSAKWQQGYATEAVWQLLDFGFNQLELERVAGRCIRTNTASSRVMEKCGFIWEGTARHEVVKEGIYKDVNRYAILAGDYKHYRGKDE